METFTRESNLIFPNDFTTLSWQQGPLLMRLARRGDPLAMKLFCILATPLVEKISHYRYFTATLGKEDAHSLANQSMLHFLLTEPLRDDMPDIPAMLKKAMKYDLMNQVAKLAMLREHEMQPPGGKADEEEEDGDFMDSLPAADSRGDPEQQFLQGERSREIRKCLEYLAPKEKYVITGLFFRQRSIKELARELHCKTAAVSRAKYKALQKLRKIFKKKLVA